MVSTGVTDEELIRILKKRIDPFADTGSDFWACDEVRDCFAGDDLEQIDKWREKKKKAMGGGDYEKHYWEFAGMPAQPKGGKGRKGKGKGKGKQESAAKRQRRHVHTRVPANLVTEAQAQERCPEGAVIAKVVDENRWAVTHTVFGLKTRSWVVYGERLALLKCLSWAWTCHAALGKGECPYEDIKNTPWESWRRGYEAPPVAPEEPA